MKTKKLAITGVLFLLIILVSSLTFLLFGVKNQPVEFRQLNLHQTDQIQVEMLIGGVEYRINIKSDSSVYDLMNNLREQKKIDFSGQNYSGMGFFIEEINGVKNNPAGRNWLYYVNGRLAPIGVSYYQLKNNDTIEWKYEKKSF
jgi:hypothetical protein